MAHRNEDQARELPLKRERTADFLSDEEILAEICAGQQDRVSILFDRYGRLIFSIANRILRDSGEAEEVTQTVLLDVIRSVDKFNRERGSAKVWILQYAYHRSMRRKNQLQSRHFYTAEEIDSVADELMRQYPRRTLSLFPQETMQLVEEVLALVDEKKRRTIELTFYEGLTAEEIAEKTGDSVTVVRHNLYRTLAKLREYIEPQQGNKVENQRKEVSYKPGEIADART